jgi:hypothetical protein
MDLASASHQRESRSFVDFNLSATFSGEKYSRFITNILSDALSIVIPERAEKASAISVSGIAFETIVGILYRSTNTLRHGLVGK